jgi:hypothetical protein
MTQTDIALGIIIFSALVGLTAATADFQRLGNSFESTLDQLNTNDNTDNKPALTNNTGSNRTFQLGSAHRHALFYVIHNDTEMSFLGDRYQLAARHVHLENRKSDIVHSHAKSVTWQDFFDTINMSVNVTNTTHLCADVKNVSYCGQAGVKLNGERATGFDSIIRQGDKFVLVLHPNSSKIFEEYASKQLPRAYKPEGERGRRL